VTSHCAGEYLNASFRSDLFGSLRSSMQVRSNPCTSTGRKVVWSRGLLSILLPIMMFNPSENVLNDNVSLPKFPVETDVEQHQFQCRSEAKYIVLSADTVSDATAFFSSLPRD
jgi:hypothetical protein